MLEDTPDDPDIPYLIAGNYSELVTEQVEYILDHNPELEAIAFANDNMAKAGYRVCAARDLLVGHDIAITGFDDIDHAKTMEPPLTSVSHSSFQFSYQALQNALMLCQGKKLQSCRMSAIFHQRSSCGCRLHTGFTTLRHISMERLRKCLPKDAITARLGGDEFVFFILTDILKHSDAILYEEKVKRRASIRK